MTHQIQSWGHNHFLNREKEKIVKANKITVPYICVKSNEFIDNKRHKTRSSSLQLRKNGTPILYSYPTHLVWIRNC